MAARPVQLAALAWCILLPTEGFQGQCLDGAIPPAGRSNITVDGTSLPLGLWLLDWDSSKLPMYLMQIIAEEKLGYHVEVGPGGPTSLSGVFALGGCDDGNDCLQNLVAGGEVGMAWHVVFDVWNWAQRAILDFKEQMPRLTPLDVGEMGYPSTDGHYVRPEVISSALGAEGLILDWYRGYNSSWYQAGAYFGNISSISEGSLKDCSLVLAQTVLRDYNMYYSWDAGVYQNSPAGKFYVDCLNGKWWLSPACRDDPSKCIPYLDYNGWGSRQILQMAAEYNMPIAYGGAVSWAEMVRLAREKNVMNYWYEPDISFIADGLVMIAFPPYDHEADTAGHKIANTQGQETKKMARPGIQEPDLNYVLSRMSLSMADQREMLFEVDAGKSQHAAACSWLKKHQSTWQTWLPDKTNCYEGQGLVDFDGEFVDAPENGTACEWCVPGFSSQLVEGTDNKRICQECSPGTFQKLPGQVQCQQCAAGRFTDQRSRTVCEDCPLATFAQGSGNSECAVCTQAHETTLLRAAQSKWECACEEGYYRAEGHSEHDGQHTTCKSCPEGMHCAAGNGDPILLEGFWADEADLTKREFSVFRCRGPLECPGGTAGSCADGREGVGCANCKPNHQLSDKGKCKPCEGASAVPIILAICAVIAILGGIMVYASRDVTKTKQNTIAIGICLGQAVVFIQSFHVLQVLKVEWSEPYVGLMKIISLMTLDLDMMNTSCFLDDSNAVSKYAMKLIMFPLGVLLLSVAMFLKGAITGKRISRNQMVNSIGLLMLVLFLVLNMQGIAPFHCIGSPNGSSSLESNPAMICYDGGEWPALAVLGGLALLVYGVAFMSWVSWITFHYPSLALSPQGMMITSRYAFLFQRFTVECYYFAPVYLLRSLFISILPVIFANYGHRQVISLSVAIVVFGSLMAWLKPLRGFLPNLLEVIITGCLVMSLLCGGMLTAVDKDVMAGDMKAFFTIIITVIFVAIFGFIGLLGWRSFRPAHMYAAFLCHHKIGCGTGARLMKLDLEQQLKASVFLDSDNLEDLDTLLDIVGCCVRNFVILLTSETLSRPWCAGEVATAFMNKVRMIPVKFDGYKDLSEEDLTVESIGGHWYSEEFAGCQRHGVTLDLVREAYVFMQSLQKVDCDRVAACLKGDLQAALRANKRVAALCRNETVVPDANSDERATTPPQQQASKGIPAHLACLKGTPQEAAVLANHMDPEAISSAAVLTRLIRQQTQWQVVELTNPSDIQTCVELEVRPKSILVLLTDGALTSQGFCQLLFGAFDSWGESAKVLPVVTERFAFPSSQAIEESIAPQASSMLGRSEEEIAGMLKQLFTMIAVRFSGTASIASLQTDAANMVSRLKGQGKGGLPTKRQLDWKAESTPSKVSTSAPQEDNHRAAVEI